MSEYKAGYPYTGMFTTAGFDTGIATDATGTPTVTMYRNGVADAGFVVTAANVTTGVYKMTGTIPSSYQPRDVVNVRVSATVGGVAGEAIVESFVIGEAAEASTSYTTLSGSFLDRAIADVRRYTDEPSWQAKYTDAVLVGMIEQCYSTVISELNRVRTTPLVAKLAITMVDSVYVYPLPPTIGSIWSIYNDDTTSGCKTFFLSRGVWNAKGRGIWIEGNNLKVQQESFTAGDIVTIEYTPNGTCRLHNVSSTSTAGGSVVSEDGTEITLATPTAGVIDTRAHAYVGSIFRVLTHTVAAKAFEQERVITAYVNTTGVITLDAALSPNPHDAAGNITYEIAPAICRGLDHVVALYLAVMITSLEGDLVRNQMVSKLYNGAIRTLRLDGYNSVFDDALNPANDGYGIRRRLYGAGTDRSI